MISFRRAVSLPSDWAAGIRQGVLLGTAVLVLTLPPVGSATSATGSHGSGASAATVTKFLEGRRLADFGGRVASTDARFVANWVTDARDNVGLPFAILDKRDARLFLFSPSGRLIDSTAVLLGAAVGDNSVAGIGKRPIADVRPEERTTPAGRFVSQPGRNATGENVVWVDYDSAVSMHRVRLIDPRERRLERLASDDPTERRISYGCINIPVSFFENVVEPLLGRQRAVVYVLPEEKSVREVFADAYPVDADTHRM